ncbi:hypothetical protein LTR49_001621 [Elasticomyces elasticus]|nr:hypothetical protein LTR49_001621 [Elasticomyces elasticus]
MSSSSTQRLTSSQRDSVSKARPDERAYSVPEDESQDDESAAADPMVERSLLRKVDLRLCTIAGILCSLNLLDSGVISSASVTSMLSDLDLSGNRFSVSIFIFTIASIAFQLPSTIAVRTFGPRRWFAFITFCFGLITMCTAFIHTWKEMIALRILLGMAMSGVYPGLSYLISTWYLRSEQQTRYAYMQTGEVIILATGSIVNFGLNKLNGKGGLAGWRYMFLVQGLITIVLGIITFFWMVDFPDQAHNTPWFLTEEEQKLAVSRIQLDRSDAQADPFAWSKVLRHATDLKVYGFACMFFLLNLVSTSLSYFLPIILQSGMGFSEDASIILSAPPYYYAVIPVIISSIVSDRYQIRGPIIVFNCICLIVGFCMLGFVDQVTVRYIGAFLATGSYVSNWAALSAYYANNIAGQWKRVFTAAAVTAMNGAGGIAGSFIVRQNEAPWYPTAMWHFRDVLTAKRNMDSDHSAEETLGPATITPLMADQGADSQRHDALEHRLARVESTTNGLVRIRTAEVDALGNSIPRFQVDPDGTRTFYLPGLFDPPVTRSTTTVRGSGVEVQDTHLSPDKAEQHQSSPPDHGKQKAAKTPDSGAGTQTQLRAITDADEDYICRTGTAQTDAVKNATGLPSTTSRQNDRPASNGEQFSIQSIRDGTAPEATVEELRRLLCDRNAECASTCDCACHGKGRAKGKGIARSSDGEHTQQAEGTPHQTEEQLLQNEHGLPAEAFDIGHQHRLGTAGSGEAPEDRPGAQEPYVDPTRAESATAEEDKTGGPHESTEKQMHGEDPQQSVSPPSDGTTDGHIAADRNTEAAKSKGLSAGRKVVKSGKNWDIYDEPHVTKNINDPEIKEGRTRNSVGHSGSLAPGSTPAPQDPLATRRTTRASSQAAVSAPVVGGTILSGPDSARAIESTRTASSKAKQLPPKTGRKAQETRGRKADGVSDDEDEDEDEEFVKRPSRHNPVPEEDEHQVSASRPLLPRSILMPAGNSNVHYEFRDVDRFSSFRPHRSYPRTTVNTLYRNTKEHDYENNSDGDDTQFSNHAEPDHKQEQDDEELETAFPPPPASATAAPPTNNEALPRNVKKRTRANSDENESDGSTKPKKKKSKQPAKKKGGKPKGRWVEAVNGEKEWVED